MRAAIFWALVLVVIPSFGMAQSSWDEALKKAKAEGKFLLAYFTDPDCFTCQRYMAQTVDNPALRRELQRFVVVKLDAKKEQKRVLTFFPNWKGVLPILVFADGNGKVVDFVVGHLNTEAFRSLLNAFLAGKRTDTIERRLKAKPNDLATLYEAAVWFLERGDGQRGLPLAQKVLQMDLDNRKGYYAAMRLHLGLYYATHQTALAHRAIDEFRAVLTRFPKSKEAEEARFYLGVTHLALGQDTEARRYLTEVVQRSKLPLLREKAKKLLHFLHTEPPADLRRGEGD